MGSSFTKFRANGFWSRDPILEIWLRSVALHLGAQADQLDNWAHSFRDELLYASSGRCNGFVSASLDEFLIDESRVQMVVEASDRAIKRLRAVGPTLPAAFLSALGTGIFDVDLPLTRFEFIHDTFNALLLAKLESPFPFEC
jgi:hypothetical protein